MDTFVNGSGVLRYRALTRDSGYWYSGSFNSGQRGYGKGIYIENYADQQKETSAPGVSGEAKWSPVPDGVGEPVRFVGATGCAAAACHGGPATGSLSGKLNSRSWSGAATHCLASDPHTKSYEALEGPLAGAIMSRLHSGAKATEDVRCLACHTNPPLAQPEVSPRERVLQKEGVSCEACHGSASKWLHEHTTWTAAGRPSGYDRSGMTKLYDLGERALACAGCHVGAPADPLAATRFAI